MPNPDAARVERLSCWLDVPASLRGMGALDRTGARAAVWRGAAQPADAIRSTIESARALFRSR